MASRIKQPIRPIDPGDESGPAGLHSKVVSRVVEIRKSKYMSQSDVAAVAGVTQPAISDLECGRTMSWTTLGKIAVALGSTLEALVFEEAFRGRSVKPQQRKVVEEMIRMLI